MGYAYGNAHYSDTLISDTPEGSSNVMPSIAERQSSLPRSSIPSVKVSGKRGIPAYVRWFSTNIRTPTDVTRPAVSLCSVWTHEMDFQSWSDLH